MNRKAIPRENFQDLIEKARRADLLAIVERLGFELRREGRSFRIPGHGGLILWNGPDGWRWTWFSQGRSGDAIAFLQEWAGMGFREAVSCLIDQSIEAEILRSKARPQSRRPIQEKPKGDLSKWRERAKAFLRWAHKNLTGLEGEAVRRWLTQERGIDAETIRRFKLGFCPREIWHKRSDWGLPVGNKDRLWLPPSLVIPYRNLQGELVGLQFRLFKPDEAKKYGLPTTKAKFRFYFLSPSRRPIFLIGGEPGQPLVVLESELDAVLLSRFAVNNCFAVAALGSAGRRPQIEKDLDFYWHFLTAPAVFLALDNDEAGRSATRWWLETYSHTISWPTPYEKDPTEFWKKSGDKALISWLLDGFKKIDADSAREAAFLLSVNLLAAEEKEKPPSSGA